MEIVGRIYRIFNTEKISENFQNRKFVIEHAENPAYPQLSECALEQSAVNIIDDFKEGDAIKAYFSLRGREWTNKKGEIKYINTIRVWKIEAFQSSADDTIAEQPIEEDDLPF